jgi:hypothetical protein
VLVIVLVLVLESQVRSEIVASDPQRAAMNGSYSVIKLRLCRLRRDSSTITSTISGGGSREPHPWTITLFSSGVPS